MSKKVVAVLFGGQSSEHEVSKVSAATVISNISQEDYYVIPVYITKDGRWMIYDGPVENITNGQWERYATHAIISPDAKHRGLLRIVGDKIKVIPVDIVIPVLHGKGGEDGTIQGLLELAGIPYVGCGLLSSAVSMDKSFTKVLVDSIGIEQANYAVVYRHELEEDMASIKEDIERELGFPCFVKPANAGSSVGISKAVDSESLEKALIEAAKHDRTIIIEENIIGRELECAVLGNNEVAASVVGEIKPAAEFYDYEAKYNNRESKTIVPADLDETVSEEIRETAIQIYKALDCSGLARVDFFLEKDTNRIVFNEINTMPGFTSISMYPMLWEAGGLNLQELINELIQLGFERFDR